MRADAVTGGQTNNRNASPWLVALLTALVMTLFAANSLVHSTGYR